MGGQRGYAVKGEARVDVDQFDEAFDAAVATARKLIEACLGEAEGMSERVEAVRGSSKAPCSWSWKCWLLLLLSWSSDGPSSRIYRKPKSSTSS